MNLLGFGTVGGKMGVHRAFDNLCGPNEMAEYAKIREATEKANAIYTPAGGAASADNPDEDRTVCASDMQNPVR